MLITGNTYTPYLAYVMLILSEMFWGTMLVMQFHHKKKSSYIRALLKQYSD